MRFWLFYNNANNVDHSQLCRFNSSAIAIIFSRYSRGIKTAFGPETNIARNF